MKITNNTNRDISTLTKTLESFVPYAQQRLEYDKPFQIVFESDEENSKNIFGKTAYYDPMSMNVHVYVDDRHDKDMLRSISHEMVHHAQNCRGEFNGAFEMGEGYAQKSPHLRNMEAEAYLVGNGFLVRDFEDSIKMGDRIVQEWKKESKEVITELKNKSNVQTLEKHVIFQKIIELATKLKIDDELEIAQLLSSFASSLGVQPQSLIKVLSRLKTDYTGDAKAAGVTAQGGAEQQQVTEGKKAVKPEPKEAEKIAKPEEIKKPITKESVKDHYKVKTQRLYKELMKRFIKKGDK